IGFGCFVLEVGLVGVIVGTTMPHPWLRWLLFGWIMLLIDLLVASSALLSFGSYVSDLLPAAALVGAQIGLAIVLGTLGTAPWYWRTPLSLALGAGLLAFWLLTVTDWNGQLISGILVTQAIVLMLMCVGLRVRGYRLVHLDSLEPAASGTMSRRFQFGIRDVLIWTTSLAILLGLMRGAGMLVWINLTDHPSLYFKGTVALVSANAIVLSLWASLGQGHWALRYSLLVVMLLLLGAALSGLSIYGEHLVNFWRSPTGPMSSRYFDYDLYHWREVGWWWIAWMFLSGGLLAASLMIFRAVGYRLIRGGTTTRRPGQAGASMS
ncbi:MAG TPA: hypothetical protein VKH44_10175, partial [Pirellulaceae bacterium]|nr:hypothetical protein [Pirellulaceae bacterium]